MYFTDNAVFLDGLYCLVDNSILPYLIDEWILCGPDDNYAVFSGFVNNSHEPKWIWLNNSKKFNQKCDEI